MAPGARGQRETWISAFGRARLRAVDGQLIQGRTEEAKRRVLFLCTGNYYRSRFAEEVFNDLSASGGLPWVADSRGLHPDIDAIGNTGTLSPLAAERLRARGYRLRGRRAPRSAAAEDLDAADLLVALDREEHEAFVLERFPRHADRVVYWDVKDIEFEDASVALGKIEEHVRALVDDLSAGS